MRKFWLLLTATLSLSPALAQSAAAPSRPEVRNPAPGELRGLWVDAFGPGLRTPQEIDRLVADARAMGVNVLFAQVGRRGDCYCNNAAMPRTEDPAVPAGFDPLQDLITKAHAQGIQVHAWIITTAIWNRLEAPKDPAHVFNTHGPSAQGSDNWLMVRHDGATRGGADYYLDPGHPQAAAYIREMYLSVVRNYDVDGIQFDRVRYPDQNEPAGQASWGYNPVALERYRAETGASGIPAPNDERWKAWRRQQVTHLVRSVYLEAKALKPNLWVSAATITYGEGPATLRDFRTKTRTYNEVLQDWESWTRLGYLDLNVMMNYKRDFVPAQASWFDQWNAFGRLARGPRYVVSGAAIYLNDQASSVNQARKAQEAGLDGWAGYSYRTPDADVNAQKRTYLEVLPELAGKLTGPGAPFAQTASWGQPSRGLHAIRGRVTAQRGPLGGRSVELWTGGRLFARTQTDGEGRYGFVIFPLGEVELRTEGAAPLRLTPALGRVNDAPELSIP
ncbi:uncharacterized lipoprotein YddW (UPF0748 family) [Deinobacterium chartae]|uniref:Uncharacterized lipoprotein YddW (UPF0748 family) n=1 Tax=Deinobacterium chartae TaxID=521158 RepID=A0A841I5V9_9DEIO|nr:family 10 glycosylhydrolase [Deinobacterium chartae]MBB6099820.1 uncharacterized lipoprotein YddW (UPF0748 family) [Deinobacterium chartae]